MYSNVVGREEHRYIGRRELISFRQILMQLAGEILIARRASPQGPQKEEREREKGRRKEGEEKIM